MTTIPRPKRRTKRFLQFSLRSLLVFVLLVSVGMSWLGVKLDRARRQREMVEELERLGGWVLYDYHYFSAMQLHGEPNEPAWVRKLLGEDFLHSVVMIGFGGTDLDDSGLSQAVRIEGIERFPDLCFADTKVTDRGVEYLKGMKGLSRLDLRNTQVTPEGVKKLQRALPKCEIVYGE